MKTCNSECGMRMKYGISCNWENCSHIRDDKCIDINHDDYTKTKAKTEKVEDCSFSHNRITFLEKENGQLKKQIKSKDYFNKVIKKRNEEKRVKIINLERKIESMKHCDTCNTEDENCDWKKCMVDGDLLLWKPVD